MEGIGRFRDEEGEHQGVLDVGRVVVAVDMAWKKQFRIQTIRVRLGLPFDWACYPSVSFETSLFF